MGGKVSSIQKNGGDYGSTLKSGSDSVSKQESDTDCVYEYVCDLCKGEGQRKEAFGYCSDCRDYLCTDCFKHHTKPKPARNHVLLDQSQMPKKHQKKPEYCCDLCEGQEEAVGYCCDCREYLCTYCFNHHRKPKPSRHHVLLDQHFMPKRKRTPDYHVMDVFVKSKDDLLTPLIACCVVLPGDKLVVVDDYNSYFKLVNLTCGDVISRMRLPGKICDITQVSSTQVAATAPNDQSIYFVNVGDKLKLDRKVKVNGECCGIASINDNLVVSYVHNNESVYNSWRSEKVEIISKTGRVLQTVISTEDRNDSRNRDMCIAVNKNRKTIYILNLRKCTITSVDLAGRIQATYNDDKLMHPCSLTVDTAGTVYVCSQNSYNVLQLTADLTEGRQLFQASDDVLQPRSVCYCEATDRLYVGNLSDVVKVFHMK